VRPGLGPGLGLLTSITLPDGGKLGLYQPRHPVAAGAATTNPVH
jgi:hypothetical protein